MRAVSSIGMLCCLFMLSTRLLAQKDEKVKYEDVKQQCSALPLEKRARISVTRFTVTTQTPDDRANAQNAQANNNLKMVATIFGKQAPPADKIPPTLGDNLSTMLTNALQGVNCYRVLESLNNNKDLTGEIDQGDAKYSSKKTPKAGKQVGAQIVVTGEVIEYSEKDKGVSVIGVGSHKKLVKIGFNLKMINPETRDIIASKVFRVSSKTASSVSVLFVSTENNDPAVAAVMEDGIIQAVEYMAKVRDSLNITADGNFAGNGLSNGDKETEITLSNANFNSFTALANLISSMPGYKSMDKSLADGIGSYSVTHNGSTDDLLSQLNKKLGAGFEVTGEEPGKIQLKAK